MAASNLHLVPDIGLQAGSRVPSPKDPMAPAAGSGEVYHFSFLDQICVVDGVCWKEDLLGTDDLILGDEYKFPAGREQALSDIQIDGAQASVQILDVVEIGVSRFFATKTHEITLMSDVGHLIDGHVMTVSDGRMIIALPEKADPNNEYVLIAKSKSHSAASNVIAAI